MARGNVLIKSLNVVVPSFGCKLIGTNSENAILPNGSIAKRPNNFPPTHDPKINQSVV
jgi:hypothetical protein